MKPLHLIAGLGVAGFLTGAFTRHHQATPVPEAAAQKTDRPETGAVTAEAAGPESTSAARKAAKSNFNHVRSTETVESLLAGGTEHLYSRLAVWLTDASEQDMIAFWEAYHDSGKRTNDLTDLVLINWTRLNPRGAIAALKGGKDEHYAWWAWASHDPKTALATAIAESPDRINNVTWGIGEFHPEWLREHFNELPEANRGNAFSGMAKWVDFEHPLESIKFLLANHSSPTPELLKAAARSDPWSTLDWLKENPEAASSGRYGMSDAMGMVIQTIADQSPDDLERLIAQTPSGEAKVKMERALFNNLLTTDPAAAMEQAKDAPPRIAAERYAAIGAGMVRTDPEGAFDLAQKLLTACPDALSPMDWVRTPYGSSGSGKEIPGVNGFVDQLMAKDPSRVMQMALASKPATGDPFERDAFHALSQTWARKDLPGYVEWVNAEPAGDAKVAGSLVVASQLRSQEQYAEAMDWAVSVPDNATDSYSSTFRQWHSQNPQEAAEWLESANLSQQRKERLQNYLENR